MTELLNLHRFTWLRATVSRWRLISTPVTVHRSAKQHSLVPGAQQILGWQDQVTQHHLQNPNPTSSKSKGNIDSKYESHFGLLLGHRSLRRTRAGPGKKHFQGVSLLEIPKTCVWPYRISSSQDTPNGWYPSHGWF